MTAEPDQVARRLAIHLQGKLKERLTSKQRDERRRFLSCILDPEIMFRFLVLDGYTSEQLCNAFRSASLTYPDVTDYLQRARDRQLLEVVVSALARMSNDVPDLKPFTGGLKNYGPAQGTTRKPTGNCSGGAHN